MRTVEQLGDVTGNPALPRVKYIYVYIYICVCVCVCVCEDFQWRFIGVAHNSIIGQPILITALFTSRLIYFKLDIYGTNLSTFCQGIAPPISQAVEVILL